MLHLIINAPYKALLWPLGHGSIYKCCQLLKHLVHHILVVTSAIKYNVSIEHIFSVNWKVSYAFGFDDRQHVDYDQVSQQALEN